MVILNIEVVLVLVFIVVFDFVVVWVVEECYCFIFLLWMSFFIIFKYVMDYWVFILGIVSYK